MKKLIMSLILCLAVVSVAYAQGAKDITGSLKDSATGVAKEKAAAAGDRAAGMAKEKAAAYVDDSTITSEVKVRFADADSLKDANISVTTKNGVVNLTGTVKSKQAKGAATNIAKGVKGVKSVNNKLTIKKADKKTK